jgi:RNA polymerase sigma-70 factor (ECF subfamily)
VKPTSSKLELVTSEGVLRLLSRSTETYGLAPAVVADRVRRGLDRYLFADKADPQDGEVLGFIDGLHADDLCLVVACEQGNEQAWRDLVSRFNSTVRSAARSASGTEDAAEDLAQSIWAELYGLQNRDGRAAGKIGYYSGRGSLGGWLRAVVSQLAVDQHRKAVRFVQVDEDAQLDRLSSDGASNEAAIHTLRSDSPDPEAALATASAKGEVEKALAKAIGELAVEDRLLVKLYYFDGLKLREAGAVLGVHEATASRRLVKIQRDIREVTSNSLAKDHGWKPAEIDAAFAEADALLNIDVEGMLKGAQEEAADKRAVPKF